MERRFTTTTRVSEERYFYVASRDVEEPIFVKTMLTTLAQRAEENAFADSHRQYYQQPREPYLRSTFLEQQGRFAPKVNDQYGQSDGAVDRRHACVYTRQVPPMKTHVVAPIDSNEAAKLFGGVVVTHYGRKYENRY